MEHADALGLSKSGHLSLKHTVNIQPLLLGFSFPTGEVGLMEDACLHKSIKEWALSIKAVSQSFPGFFSLGSSCLCQEWWAPMRTVWVFCQKQEWTSAPGKHIFRHLSGNYNSFALREEPDWPLLKYYFCLVRLYFPGWCISRQEEFPQK